MKKTRILNVLAVSALLLSSLSAFAGSNNKLIKESGDWGLWETKLGDKDVCYLQTNTDDYYLLVMKMKNDPSQNVELMMQLPTNRRKVTGMIMTMDGVPGQIAFSDLNGNKVNYWGVPKNFSQFMAQMRAQRKDVQILGVGGERDEKIRISTSGFDSVTKEMEKRCNGGASLLNSDMESLFLNAVSDAVNPVGLDPSKATQLRNIYAAAFKDVLEIEKTQGDLNVVLNKYKPLTDEMTNNRAAASKIENSDLPNSRSTLADSQRQQVDSKAEVARIDSLIPGMQSKIQVSQRAADAAKAAIAPYEPEYNRITGNLNAASSQLSQAQSRLSYIDSTVSNDNQQISNLDYEARSLEQRLPSERNDLNRSQDYLRNAQNQRASYNVSFERDRRLRSNPQYGRLSNDLGMAERNLQVASQQLNQARMQRDQAARALQQCRLQPIQEVVLSDVVSADDFPGLRPGFPGGPGHGPGGPGGPGFPGGPGHGPGGPGGPGFPGGPGHGPGGPGGPGFPGGPGHGPGGPGQPGGPGPHPQPPTPQPPVPQPPTPQPPKDCSAFEQALNNANAVLNQRQSEANQAQYQRDQVASQVQQIERMVDRQVNDEYQRLVQIEQSARQDADQRASLVQNDESRVSQIRYTDIPRLDQERSQLSSERPSVVDTINSANSNIARLTQEFSRFKASSGWDQKSSAVQSTSQQLQNDQSTLASAQSQKSAAQSRIQQAALTESQMKAQIDSLTAQLNSLNQRAAQLQQGLANLPAERAPFDAKLATLSQSLSAKQANFLDLLK